jgi:predicted unusual protein kinase regulating ubiquinone biosynthesis (AarF/ABC1/UbiB family)
MVQRNQERLDGFTLKQRREQVLARLAAFGLARGPHRIVRESRKWDGEASLGFRLRLAAADLGPIFSLFGRYLATRVDLLPASDCLELETIRDDATPMPYEDVRQLIQRETGFAPEEVFLSFESAPYESHLLYQLHHARLQSGMPVVVKLVRTDAISQWLCDLELLELIETTIGGRARGMVIRNAITDFAAMLRQQMDLAQEAKALETLAHDANELDMLRVPQILRELSSTSVLTIENLPDTRLRDPNGVLDRQGIARLLCSVWLRQALMGHIFPVEAGAANIGVISDKQVAFTGGAFSSLPGDSQANLWNYLIASAGDNPDHACSCLLNEMRAYGPSDAGEDLRHRFRQVVPFRDTGWYVDDNKNHLIEHLVVHWQAATHCGYVPQSHLASFCRGLFAIARAAQQLSPETDPLLEGLQEARLLESVARMREMFSLQRLGDHADRYAALLMGMPQRLDQALTLASEGTARVKLHVPEKQQREKNSTAVMTAMLLLLAAVAFALPRVTSSFVGNDWAGRINAVAFVVCGALLLFAMGRAR